MSNTDDLSERESVIALRFLLTFGPDWVENKKVREFIFDDQIDGVRLHKFLEDRIDPLKPLNGVTHRRLKTEVLEMMKN